MLMTSNFMRGAVAAASLLIAGGAFAATSYTAELGAGHLSGKEVHKGDNSDNSVELNAAFGVEFDNGLGARVLAIGDAKPFRGYLSTDRSFDNFIGVEATGSYEIASRLNLRGGLGIGRSNLDEGVDDAHKLIADGILSIGLQYRFARHYAMELRVDHLTASGVTSAGVQFQVPF